MTYVGIEELTEEESLLRKEVHEFAKGVIRPASIEIDRMGPEEYQENITKKDSPYWEVVGEMRKLGYHRAAIPEEFGGEGFTGSETYALVEEIAWGSSGFSIDLGVDLMPFTFTAFTFDEDLQEEYVEPFLRDTKGKVSGCWAVTEPEHGSDLLLSLELLSEGTREEIPPGQVTAERAGDKWIVNGQKSAFVSGAPTATHAALHTDMKPGEGDPGRGCLVPLDLPGVIKGKPILKIGQREEPQGELIFEDVEVPDKFMTLDPKMLHPDTGYVPITQVLCSTSSWMAASSTGLARAAFEEALRYSREREQGGKPIKEHQLVKKKLYDMFIKVETSRAYAKKVMEHVWDRQYGKYKWDASYRHSLAAQVYCKEKAFEVANDALQIHGGYGTTRDYLVEKLFRDARVKLIEDGTTEALSLEGARDVVENY